MAAALLDFKRCPRELNSPQSQTQAVADEARYDRTREKSKINCVISASATVCHPHPDVSIACGIGIPSEGTHPQIHLGRRAMCDGRPPAGTSGDLQWCLDLPEFTPREVGLAPDYPGRSEAATALDEIVIEHLGRIDPKGLSLWVGCEASALAEFASSCGQSNVFETSANSSSATGVEHLPDRTNV